MKLEIKDIIIRYIIASQMYLNQDILQYSIVPALGPQELVSFSITSTIFYQIVQCHISNTVIGRMNNIFKEFLGDNVDKLKQYMNSTGTFIFDEMVLQCVLDEYWWNKSKEGDECLNLYNKVTGDRERRIICGTTYMFAKSCGFEMGTSPSSDIDMYNKGKQQMYVVYGASEYGDYLLSNCKSKYYVRDNVERVEIIPSYGSLIRKTVKYDQSYEGKYIWHALRRLKENDFKIDIKFDEMCGIIKWDRHIKLFEVSFIDCTYLDNGNRQFNYEYKSGKKKYLDKNYDDPLMIVSGNIISFVISGVDPHPYCNRSSYYDCPLDICGYDKVHFHHDVYIQKERADHHCIFIIV